MEHQPRLTLTDGPSRQYYCGDPVCTTVEYITTFPSSTVKPLTSRLHFQTGLFPMFHWWFWIDLTIGIYSWISGLRVDQLLWLESFSWDQQLSPCEVLIGINAFLMWTVISNSSNHILSHVEKHILLSFLILIHMVAWVLYKLCTFNGSRRRTDMSSTQPC